MKNAIYSAVAVSCFLAAAQIQATERTFMVTSYLPDDAISIVEEHGSLPKHSFVAENGTMIWSIFDAEDRNAEMFIENSLDAYVVSESRLPELRTVCLHMTEPDSAEQKRCLADFNKLMEIVYE